MKLSIIVVIILIIILFLVLILGFQNKDEPFTNSENDSEETLQIPTEETNNTTDINMDLGVSTETEDMSEKPIQSKINTKCIVKTAVNSPLQSCSNISDNLISNIPNYNDLVNAIEPILQKVETEIITTRNQYSSIIDTTLKDYQNNENLIRQQKYFLLQNKNVSTVNDAYNADLSKKTDTEKEKLNIEIDTYQNLKSSEIKNAATLNTYKQYTKILCGIIVIVIIGNVLMSNA